MYRKLKITLATTLAMVAAMPAITLATAAAAKLFGIELSAQPSLKYVLERQGVQLLETAAAVVVVCPVVEEIIFRLLAFALPTARMKSVYAVAAVAVASSALFSFVHYVDLAALATRGDLLTRSPDNAFAALFLLGLVQCWLYRRTRSVWWPVLQHALFNSVNLALLFAFPGLATA